MIVTLLFLREKLGIQQQSTATQCISLHDVMTTVSLIVFLRNGSIQTTVVVRPIIWWGSLLETAGADQEQPLTKLIYLVLSHRSRERVHSAFTTWNTAKSVGNVTAARSIHTLNSTELLSLLTKCLDGYIFFVAD